MPTSNVENNHFNVLNQARPFWHKKCGSSVWKFYPEKRTFSGNWQNLQFKKILCMAVNTNRWWAACYTSRAQADINMTP